MNRQELDEIRQRDKFWEKINKLPLSTINLIMEIINYGEQEVLEHEKDNRDVITGASWVANCCRATFAVRSLREDWILKDGQFIKKQESTNGKH